MSLLDKSVTKADDDTWTFTCPGVPGDACGPADGPGFTSSGWPTKKVALARGREHFDEHLGKGPASELADFRNKHGLVVDDNGRVHVLADMEG